MALALILDPENDTSFLNSVRRLLGGLDEEDLTDEHILDPIIFDVAEMEILSQVPCISEGTLSDEDKHRVRLAMTYLLASKLCPTVKGMVEYEVRTIDVSWKKKPVEYDDLQENLIASMDSMLEQVECYEGGHDSDLFKIAPSKRKVRQREEL